MIQKHCRTLNTLTNSNVQIMKAIVNNKIMKGENLRTTRPLLNTYAAKEFKAVPTENRSVCLGSWYGEQKQK